MGVEDSRRRDQEVGPPQSPREGDAGEADEDRIDGPPGHLDHDADSEATVPRTASPRAMIASSP